MSNTAISKLTLTLLSANFLEKERIHGYIFLFLFLFLEPKASSMSVLRRKTERSLHPPWLFLFLFLFLESKASSKSSKVELAEDFSPIIRVYKNGTVERLWGTATVPPSTDPKTGVKSKDVVISKEPPISARLYIPKSAARSPQKLPLLVFIHGGGFCIESSSSPEYHYYLNSLVSQANVVAVSVDYRLAPEHPLPIAYEDSWTAVKWVDSHFGGNGSEDWLNRFADLNRVFFAGDSAGANIAHHLGLKFGVCKEGLVGVKLVGVVLIHPYFWGGKPVGLEASPPGNITDFQIKTKQIAAFWKFAYPSTSGVDDPLFNPAKDPKLGAFGSEKVLVCVAEKDILRNRGWYYAEVLEKSGWKGAVEVMEAKGEGHVFFLSKPTSENAVAMQKKIVSFLN